MRPLISTLAAVVLTFASACAGGAAEAPPSAAEPAPAKRLVVMAPAGAEMIEALGALDAIVGVGDFVLSPAALRERPRVGAYDAPNIERILDLEADAFVTAESQAAAPAHTRLEALGVQVVALDTSTYRGVFESLGEVGRLVGREDLARALTESMERELDAVEAKSAGAPRRSVLFVVGRDPLYVAGPGSHADEMIALAGGVNIAHDSGAPYARMSIEAVLERMPDVIVDASDNRPGALRGREGGAWAEWSFLPAVRGSRVYWVDPSRLSIPGIRLGEMTERLGRFVHPEIFGEPVSSDYGPVESQGS